MHKFTSLTDELNRLEPGKLPLDLFNAISRLLVMPVIEVVPFYREHNKLKVLLLKRSDNDEYWPSKYHLPGTILLPADSPGSLNDPLERVHKNKLSDLQISSTTFIDAQLCHVSRGTELAIIFASELASVNENVKLFDADNLPSDIIEGHAHFIDLAINKLST